jgi:hypothetical protein
MGINIFGSSSSYDEPQRSRPSGNPDPSNYTIRTWIQIGSTLVVMVNYPDCHNHEGDKILVYRDCFLKELEEQDSIDPHFAKNTYYFSPFARFEPTEHGWTMARILAEELEKE